MDTNKFDGGRSWRLVLKSVNGSKSLDFEKGGKSQVSSHLRILYTVKYGMQQKTPAAERLRFQDEGHGGIYQVNRIWLEAQACFDRKATCV